MTGETQRRRRRRPDEWRHLIADQVSSGQTQVAYCAERDISVVSLRYWKRRLADEAPKSQPWVELGTLAERERSGWDIELDLGDGVCLRLRRC